MENNELNKIIDEIKTLDEQYKNSITGRKEIIIRIKELIKLFRSKYDNNSFINEMENKYSYRDYYINDYKMVMNLLLKLANNNEDIYGIKEIVATDFVTVNNETKQLYGKTLIITNRDVLDTLNSDLYYYDEFSEVAKEIINKGYSMIIVTYNYFDGKVKPNINSLKNVNTINIKNGGLVGNITCYLHDDSLKTGVESLIDYIDINGPDFENIDEELLYNEIINNFNNRENIKRR